MPFSPMIKFSIWGKNVHRKMFDFHRPIFLHHLLPPPSALMILRHVCEVKLPSHSKQDQMLKVGK